MRTEIEIIETILSAAELSFDSSGWPSCPFEHSPKDYIRFAKEDLKSGLSAGLLNSIHNAKRAIECRINWLIHFFGIGSLRKNLKSKMESLTEINAGPPRILAEIIRKRNLLEHEFASAEQREAEDILEIAELFVYATKSYCEQVVLTWYCHATPGSEAYEEIELVLDEERSKLKGFLVRPAGGYNPEVGPQRSAWVDLRMKAWKTGEVKELNDFYEKIAYQGEREFFVTKDSHPHEFRKLVAMHIQHMKDDY
jgi:hypothetical protein